jgi:regulator of protease activity HflC (stomatin/prohibitin superfamily)
MQKAVEKKKLDAIQADTRKIVAEIKETERAEVLKIQAEAALEVQKLNSEKQKILKKHQAEAEAEAEKLKAEADAYVGFAFPRPPRHILSSARAQPFRLAGVETSR